jgi:hypothetical protein
MNFTNNRIIYTVVCAIIFITLIWWLRNRKETFTPDTTVLDKIRTHVTNSSGIDYSGSYLKFLVENNIADAVYLEQSFYYGCIALKKLGILTNENIIKLI